MTTNKKNIKVTFAPGAFDDFEGTQEELDELIKILMTKIETGQLFEELINIEDLIDDDDNDDDEITKPKILH